MPGNDFEKQVQQKMDELSFVPSDAVWPEVEKQIGGRKKRRVLFVWMPLLLLLLGGATWIYVSGTRADINKKQVAEKNNAAVVSKSNTAAVSASNAGNKEAAPHAAQSSNASNPHLVTTDKKTLNNTREIKESAAIAATLKKHERSAIEKNSSRKTEMSVVVNPGNKINKYRKTYMVAKTMDTPKDTRGANNALTATGSKKSRKLHTGQAGFDKDAGIAASSNEVISEKTAANESEPVAMEKAGVSTATPAADAEMNSSLDVVAPVALDSVKQITTTDSVSSIAKSKKEQKKSKKKIEWGINLRGGYTNISNGISGVFSGTQSYDASAYFNNLSNSSVTQPGGGIFNGSLAKPSDIKTGLSYAAGFFIRTALQNNISISAGLNYSYYSNRMDIGTKIDSNKALDQYRTGSAATYTNRFHFIELPVTIEKQLGKKSRFSVNGGLAFSLLAGSNALLYDAQKNIYTAGKSQINKMQFSLLAGARYRLFEKRLPVEIGPGFNYALGNLFSKELYGSRHLFFAGINARIFLSR